DDSGQRLLDAAQCVDVEPALAPLAASLHGGIYSPGDEVADCHLFCTELLRRLRASPAFHLHTGQSVSALLTEGKRVRSVVLGRDDIAIDHLVVAAGTGSVGLLRPLGIDLPIYPLKGYSLTVGLADQDRVPQTNVTDYDNKVVYARLDDQLRVAAMVDIAGWDAGLDQQRIATLQRLAGATFPGAGDYQHARQWAGLRPATPQGTPLLGRSNFDNLWLNVGHGSLGFTLACGSADLLASVIGGSPPAVSLDGLSLPA
ncbi:MAG TPA: FAD-dependent oxidoreductase, partial [Solimonas sp.]